MGIRLKHLWLGLSALPGLLSSKRQRLLLREMRALSRQLPQIMQLALPQAMQRLAPCSDKIEMDEGDVRRLADFAALLERNSPLGFCLRRSLLRYHFLGRAGIPLSVAFGARRREGTAQRTIAGHAWVTLEDRPYCEADEHWRDYHVVYRWPQGE